VIRRIVVILTFIIIAAGCSSGQGRQEAPIPTIFPTSTPNYGNPELAEQVATSFLHHWKNSDFEQMYRLLNQASKDATPYENFRAFYENAYEIIRFDSVNFRLLTATQDNFRVIRYGYEATFQSNVLGEFVDSNRELVLVLDELTRDWQVAWSPATIFTEMGQGALLRYEAFPPRRASIYDRDGRILADMNGGVVSVLVVPGEMPNYDACISTLAQVLDTSVEEMQAKMTNYAPTQLAEVGIIELGVYREWQQALVNVCNPEFDDRPTRRYINGDLAPHIIGYVGYPDESEIPAIEAAGFPRDAIVGRSGIEKSWDETLRGRPGAQLSLVTPDGDLLRILAESAPQPPQSVYLTIDSELPRFALATIAEAYANARDGWAQTSDGGSIIVMEVNTGAILAMVSYPTFNANAFNTFPVMGEEEAQRLIQQVQENEADPLLNRPAQGQYPVGSTMKPVTAIAALDSGVYTFDERYTSIGIWDRDIPRTDWLPGGHGTVNLADALTHSCNTCFYEAGYRMNETDPWILPNYADRMGLGRPSGLTDLVTAAGLIGNPDNKPEYENTGVAWNFSDAVNIAIGQGGVQITPLQLLRTYNAIANGGTLYRPQLVDRTGLLHEFSYQMQPDPMETIDIPLETLDYIREGLCKVTTASYGTARHKFEGSQLQSLGVCGKTGTAQDPPREIPHAWFVGYAPRENPEIIVLAMVENSGDGSEVAAPLVRKIMEYYFFGPDEVTP